MRALVRWLGLAGLTLTPASAAGQFFSGIVVEQGNPSHRIGVQLGGTAAVGLTSRLALRFDLAYVTFGRAPGYTYHPLCPPPSSGFPPCGPVRVTGTRLVLASTTVSLRYLQQRDRHALYWMAGVGLYALSDDDSRLGWNVGGGLRLSRSVFVDVRYHQLIGPRTTSSFIPVQLTRSLIPVSFGIRF